MANEVGQFDRQSAARIADATRYVERLQRNDAGRAAGRGAAQPVFEFGKLDQAVTAGRLSGAASTRTFSVWLGPGHETDADLGHDILLDHAKYDGASGDYGTATYQRGKWYWMPWDCPEEA